MKKILIAKQNLEKTYSGATRTVHEQIKYFKSLGHEVHTVGELTNQQDIEAAGAISHKTFRWPWQKKFKRRLQFSTESEKLAKKIHTDLVIGHGDLQHQNIFLLHNCVHLANERIHEKPLSPSHEMHQTHYPILANQQFDHLVANSELMKSDLVERFQIPELNISVIYPSIDTKQFYPYSKDKKQELKKALGVQEGEKLVGLITSGNFKKRGVDRFFQAINLMPKELVEKTHFVFVGKDKLDEQTQQIYNQSLYKERIRFLPINEAPEDYFNALDVFVLPARIEEFGRVVAEAMACETAVVTTRWVGASELMEGASREFIYEGDNNNELAMQMTQLLTQDNLRDEVAKLNAKSALKISHEETFKRFDSIFASFL